MAEGIIERKGKRGSTHAVVISLGRDPATGKYRQKWVSKGDDGRTFKTVREAKAHRRKLLDVHEDGGEIVNTRISLGDYLDQWLSGHAPHLSPVTLEGYHSIVRVHLKPALGHLPLRGLGPHPIRDYMKKKLDAGKSAETVRYHLAILHEALGQAVKDGLRMTNPMVNVDRPERVHKEMTVLDEEQVRLFLAEAKRFSPYYRLYLAAVTTGMRQGELLGLRWRDVDLTLGVASVQQTFYRLNGKGIEQKQLFKQPKTAKSRRQVDLAPFLIEELRVMREEQKALRKEFGPLYEDHDLVFCQSNGKPLHARNIVRRDIRNTLSLKGLRAESLSRGVAEDLLPKPLPKIRFHDLRHCHATLLLQQGVHPKVVQERLGHSTIAMTLDTYSHVMPGMQRQAVADFAERLFGHSTPTGEANR